MSRRAFSAASTIVYHLGGRGGVHRSFERWWLPLRYIAFEPEPAEAEVLRRQQTREGFEVAEVAVGDRPGPRAFHIYELDTHSPARPESQELSSLLRFAPGRTHRYRDADVRLVETVTVELDTIDGVATRRGDEPTFLVADIQGGELIALAGARNTLRDSLLGVRLEVSFIPLYDAQPLFGDVDAAMRSYGFGLVRLEHCGSPTFGPSTDAGPFSRVLDDARPAWADAVYVRDAPRPGAQRWQGRDLANLVCFTLANGVGSVGLDILYEALEAGYLAESLGELDVALRTAVARLALEHLGGADTAAVTSDDPNRRERDAGRRGALRRALEPLASS